jgi:glycerol-3-phosphate dehydrogenase
MCSYLPFSIRYRPREVLPSLTIHCWRQEYALKATDVLARRTRLAYLDSEAARSAAPRVIQIMGKEGGVCGRRKTC